MEQFKNSKIILNTDVLQSRIAEIGRQITIDYAGQDLILIGVLKGSLYFLADLTRVIDMPVQIDFITIGTIPNTTNQTGIVKITKDLDLDISGKHVLLIEDIIRTGLTTAYLVQNLRAHLPASIKVCTLLVNQDQQMITVPLAYCGFDITRNRLVGYGMDINEKGRNLPYIAELSPNDL